MEKKFSMPKLENIDFVVILINLMWNYKGEIHDLLVNADKGDEEYKIDYKNDNCSKLLAKFIFDICTWCRDTIEKNKGNSDSKIKVVTDREVFIDILMLVPKYVTLDKNKLIFELKDFVLSVFHSKFVKYFQEDQEEKKIQNVLQEIEVLEKETNTLMDILNKACPSDPEVVKQKIELIIKKYDANAIVDVTDIPCKKDIIKKTYNSKHELICKDKLIAMKEELTGLNMQYCLDNILPDGKLIRECSEQYRTLMDKINSISKSIKSDSSLRNSDILDKLDKAISILSCRLEEEFNEFNDRVNILDKTIQRMKPVLLECIDKYLLGEIKHIEYIKERDELREKYIDYQYGQGFYKLHGKEMREDGKRLRKELRPCDCEQLEKLHEIRLNDYVSKTGRSIPQPK